MHIRGALGFLLMAFLLFGTELTAQPSSGAAPLKSPLSPQEALKHFRLSPGLRMELVAAEPLIESPVAMAFDEDGKLWVVEMRDYPNGPAPGKPPQGRIRLLEDRDGDGYYEHSSVFADGLLFANGLLPWRGGVLVTAAPYIIHLRDTRNAGKADKKDILFEGFAAQNPQLRVSHPVLGIDNWIYVANGLRGGKVKRSLPGKQQGAINLGGMDFRFDLLRDRYEAISGMGQYGNTFDDWGRRFVCDNRHHLRHVVIEDRYLKRNPYLAAPAVVEDISELEEGPLSSGGKIFPISSNWTTSNLHAGRFTAACGVFVYRDRLLGKDFQGSVFTCDPTGNLVHQEILEPYGASFRSRPARKGVEFLASPDDWFRPVFLSSGPDGALYVVDMYRAVIEHPEWMPPELRNRPDITWGKDKGRIWRIVGQGARIKREGPRLSKVSPRDLTAYLEMPDAWFRLTAQRLLLELQDKGTQKNLRQMTLASKEALARLHAAWLLENQGELKEFLVLRLLKDQHPRVREHALLFAEKGLKDSHALQENVVLLARDPDPRIRFQAALSLGEWDDDRILPPLAHIALAGVEDRWTRLAVASAVPRRGGLLLQQLVKTPGALGQLSPARLLLVQELTALIGARRDAGEVELVLNTLKNLPVRDPIPWQMAGLNGLTEGLGRRGNRLESFLKSLPSVQKTSETAKAPLVQWLDGLFDRSSLISSDVKQKSPDRLAAIRLLAHAPWPVAEAKLTALMTADPDQEIRLAAVRALAAHDRPEVPKLMMKFWRGFTPSLRREVLEAMLRQPARVEVLLDELAAKRLKPGDLDPLRTQQLLNHPQAKVRLRARKLLHDNLPADRKQVLERYQAALKLKGNPLQGRDIFKKNCAACHRIAGIGVNVGPDISDTRTKTASALLVDILNPNQAIDNNAISYLVSTKSGKSLTGLIAAETASSITLRRAEGQTDLVLRQDIEAIQSTGVSLMPEGFEKSVSIPEMADLLAFLKNWRYLGGAVPGAAKD